MIEFASNFMPAPFALTGQFSTEGVEYISLFAKTYPANFLPQAEEEYVPVTAFDNPLVSVPFSDLGKYTLKPAFSVLLPEKALAVDGKYPGSIGYPLRGKMGWIFRDLTDTRELPWNIRLWFSNAKLPLMKNPELIWLFLSGDVMPGRGIEKTLQCGESGIEAVFSDTLHYLRSADFALCNLEGPVSENGIPERKSFTFRHSPDTFKALVSAGYDYFSFANNHIWDFGEQGFNGIFRNIQGAQVLVSGIGKNIFEAAKPVAVYRKNFSAKVISVGAYPPERNGFDGVGKSSAGLFNSGVLWATKDIQRIIGNAFGDRMTFNIASVHGGTEWSKFPTREFRSLCSEFANSGADLVIGHHPHVVQGMAVEGKTLVLYSLGNFLFPGMDDTPGGTNGCFFRIGIIENRIAFIERYLVDVSNAGTCLSGE